MRYVLTGGGGSPFYPMGLQDRFHHYLVVEAGPDGLRETVVPLEGRPFTLPPVRETSNAMARRDGI